MEEGNGQKKTNLNPIINVKYCSLVEPNFKIVCDYTHVK